MKKYMILTVLVMSIATVSRIQADDTPRMKRQTDESKTIVAPRDYSKEMHTSYADTKTNKEYFRANEVSVDLFGFYAVKQSQGLYNDDFGGGLGFNYFFSKYVGIGVDAYAWDGSKDDTVIAASGNLILRYPIESCHLAPYIFAGPGGHFGPTTQVSGQGGAGLEYRFTEHVGVFADARYVFTDKTNDYILPRLGLRLAF